MKDACYPEIPKVISTRTGLRIVNLDGGVLGKIVQSRMCFHGMDSGEEYLRLLGADTGEGKREREELIVHITVGESYFFRDRGQFELLRSRILPELAKRRETERRIRVWSAGCATGEEPYSLAILLRETLPGFPEWKVDIVGTDIKEEFLEKARKGVYGDWSFRNVDPEIREKYFTGRKGRWELDSEIRSMVAFRREDLVEGGFPEMGGELRDMDLILCRNVFIYYKRTTVAAMVEKMARTLRDGGYLITGHWELFSISFPLLTSRLFPESLVYERVREFPTGTREASPSPVFPLPLPKAGTGSPAPLPPFPPFAAATSKRQGPLSPEELFKNGAYREAAEGFEKALQNTPGDFQALCLAARARANIGEHAPAVEYLHAAVRINPLSPEPYGLLARVAEEKGNREEAMKNMEKVIYLEPSSVPAYLELASIQENGGEMERARKTRKAALEILKRLPRDHVIEPYGEAVEKLIEVVERLV